MLLIPPFPRIRQIVPAPVRRSRFRAVIPPMPFAWAMPVPLIAMVAPDAPDDDVLGAVLVGGERGGVEVEKVGRGIGDDPIHWPSSAGT